MHSNMIKAFYEAEKQFKERFNGDIDKLLDHMEKKLKGEPLTIKDIMKASKIKQINNENPKDS